MGEGQKKRGKIRKRMTQDIENFVDPRVSACAKADGVTFGRYARWKRASTATSATDECAACSTRAIPHRDVAIETVFCTLNAESVLGSFYPKPLSALCDTERRINGAVRI